MSHSQIKHKKSISYPTISQIPNLVGGIPTSLKKYESQLFTLFPTYMECQKCSKPPTSNHFDKLFVVSSSNPASVHVPSYRPCRELSCRVTPCDSSGSPRSLEHLQVGQGRSKHPRGTFKRGKLDTRPGKCLHNYGKSPCLMDNQL